MKEFKFFKKPVPAKQNMYMCYHMDEVLIHVLRYKQLHNIGILNHDTPFDLVNVPINGWMRINNWRTYDNVNPLMVEIDYSVIETNTTARHYTFRMESTEFISRVNTERL